jgi:hypothetical protein
MARFVIEARGAMRVLSGLGMVGAVALSFWITLTYLNHRENARGAIQQINWDAEPPVVNRARQFKRCVSGPGGGNTCIPEFNDLARAVASTTEQWFDYQKSGFFDTFIKGEWLILRRAGCSDEDVRHRIIAWSAWSRTKKPENENQVKYGQFGAYHPIDVEGRRRAELCLVVIELPLRDLKHILIILFDATKTNAFWKLDQVW